MTRLIQLMAESSDLVLQVIKNSGAKDTLLERIAPLAEKAEQAQGENIRSDFKENLRDFLGHDPAVLEAKKLAEEQVLKLQAEFTLLQGKNEEFIKEKNSAEAKLAHAVVLKVKSHEQANYYKDKLETLLKKHEELKKKSAKELSAMKAKHNEEFLKMKTELEEARKVNAEFCQAAQPILDNLHAVTAGMNTSSFETIIELLQSAPSRLKKIILDSASVAYGQTLAVIPSLISSQSPRDMQKGQILIKL
uniref:Uncharacterized protein n=1 Tax=Leersia perrieri TaxID=77586 RepID=A0A0D9X728_9ORYZ